MNNIYEVLSNINAVEGFEPMQLAVEYVDMNTGETNKRLPVKGQMAWFRLKYPEGKIALSVKPVGTYFVAEAKVYRSYQDAPENYLAEASAARGPLQDKPTVSPREWAQTAAIGIALRNAGFGLQFQAAGDSFEEPAVDELGGLMGTAVTDNNIKNVSETSPGQKNPQTEIQEAGENITTPGPAQVSNTSVESEVVPENPLDKAMAMMCPASKYKDKTLGDMIHFNPGIFNWIIKTFGEESEIGAAAKLICEHAVQVAG